MVQTTKFSQFANGGNLQNSDITVGLQGGLNAYFNNPWTFLPPGSTVQRPPVPDPNVNYRLRFNTDTQSYEFYDAVSMQWQHVDTSPSGNFIWNEVLSPTMTLENDNGYLTNCGSSLVTYTLPATSEFGSVIEILGTSGDGWKIIYGASQLIRLGNVATTVTTGFISSTDRYDTIRLVCTIANTVWQITSSIGNLTLV